MKKMKLMGPFASLVLLLQLPACQTIAPVSPHGALSFRFNAPAAANSLAFQIKAFPAGTKRFEIEISGQGMSTPLTETVEFIAGEVTKKKTIPDLPVGEKKVTVRAVQDKEVLASASTTVTIEAGKVTQAPLELTALKAEVMVQLESALPLDLQLKLKISGEGLDAALEKTVTIPANQAAVALGILPLGAKQVSFEMIATLNGQQIVAPAIESALNVTVAGGALTLSASKLWSSFANDFENLINQTLQTNPLALIAWGEQLKSNPARLRELFFSLPPAVRQRLRGIALIASFLPAEPDVSPSPTAPPASPEPKAEPGVLTVPSPAATVAPVTAFSLLADTRLALVQPDNPHVLMGQPPENLPGLIRIPKEDKTILVVKNKVWGMLLRSSYSGPKPISYFLAVRRQGETATLVSINGNLSKQFKVDKQTFSGDAVPFGNGNLVSVQSGIYDMKIDVRDPDSPKAESHYYQLIVS